jgi:hypothetical protein
MMSAQATTGGDSQSAMHQIEQQAKPPSQAKIAIALPHHLPSEFASWRLTRPLPRLPKQK